MLFVTFTGLDGSGKSTQLELLKEKLAQEKKSFFSFHIIEFSLANRWVKKIKKEKSASAKTTATWLTLILRKIFLFIDLWRFRFFFQKMKAQKIDFLLADRYFFDQIANIFYLSRKEIPLAKPFWQKLAEKMLIQPQHGFYLAVSPEVIQRRDRAIEQNSNYLEKKRTLLDKLARDWNLETIKAQDKKEVVADFIWQKIKRNIE